MQIAGESQKGGSGLTLTPLTQVLLGITAPSLPLTASDITFLDPMLNQSQKDAVRFTLQAAEVALIHGPPGVCISRSTS